MFLEISRAIASQRYLHPNPKACDYVGGCGKRTWQMYHAKSLEMGR
jgi:hypothetical protein